MADGSFHKAVEFVKVAPVRKPKAQALTLRAHLAAATPWADDGWLRFFRAGNGWAIVAHSKQGVRIAWAEALPELLDNGVQAWILPAARWTAVLDHGPLRLVPLDDGRVAIHAGASFRFTPARAVGLGDSWGHLVPEKGAWTGKIELTAEIWARKGKVAKHSSGWGNIDPYLERAALDCGGDAVLYFSQAHNGAGNRTLPAVVRGSNAVLHILHGAVK
jgi:hypothetical protein